MEYNIIVLFHSSEKYVEVLTYFHLRLPVLFICNFLQLKLQFYI